MDIPKAIEIQGKEYPVTEVTLDHWGDIRSLTVSGIIEFPTATLYPFRVIKEDNHA